MNNLMMMILIIFPNFNSDGNTENKGLESVHPISIKSISGEQIKLESYKGKYILFVNVASKCGFTSQYKDLQELHKKYKEQLVIIGLPCNQFGGQEPGTHEEIETFCKNNYGVEFLITEKLDVKGKEQHELYTWLTQEELNGVKSSTVKWNFQKYLVDKNGRLVDVYYSTTKPMSEKILKRIK
jgi:glutathione peroxidase